MKEKLLSVLIVDDEDIIRQDLKLLDWESMGAVLVGEATDGEEALDFCREYPPDVVTTDITMPVMDGMELFANLRKEFPDIQVIILSCHSEFKFAKEALRLGAVDYLIKAGLSTQDMKGSLEKARDEIFRNTMHHMSIKAAQRGRITKLFVRIADGFVPDMKDFSRLCSNDGLKIEFPMRITTLYIMSYPGNVLFLEEELTGLLNSYSQHLFWIKMGMGMYILFFDGDISRDREMLDKKLADLSREFNESITKNLGFTKGKVRFFISVSPLLNDFPEYIHAIRTMDSWKNVAFYDEENNIFHGQPTAPVRTSPELLKELEDSLKELENSSIREREYAITRFVETAVKAEIAPPELKTIVIKRLGKMEKEMEGQSIISEKIWQSNTVSDLADAFLHEIGMRKNGNERYRTEVRDAIKIINDRIGQPLKLSDVAFEVGLSSCYFSRVFSEEVGESFNDYITRSRIQKAMELLQSSNLKVYEVAEKVGMPNYRYFSMVFKNYTGLTPKDVKKG